MKKAIAIVLIGILLVSALTACGRGSEPETVASFSLAGTWTTEDALYSDRESRCYVEGDSFWVYDETGRKINADSGSELVCPTLGTTLTFAADGSYTRGFRGEATIRGNAEVGEEGILIMTDERGESFELKYILLGNGTLLLRTVYPCRRHPDYRGRGIHIHSGLGGKPHE